MNADGKRDTLFNRSKPVKHPVNSIQESCFLKSSGKDLIAIYIGITLVHRDDYRVKGSKDVTKYS